MEKWSQMSLFLMWFYSLQNFSRECSFEGGWRRSCDLFHVVPFSLSFWLLITLRLRSPQEHQRPGRTLCLSGPRTLTWPWYNSPSTARRRSAWPWKTSIPGLRTTSLILSTWPSQAGRYYVPKQSKSRSLWPNSLSTLFFWIMTWSAESRQNHQ